MNNSESLANQIVEHLILGSTMHYRSNQSAGVATYDFDLIYPDGTKVPLEVTESLDRIIEATEAAIRKKGFFIPRNRCKKDWYVHPAADAKINEARTKIDGLLADVETEGYEKFFSNTGAAHSPAIKRLFAELKIEAGSVLEWKQPGIGIAFPGREACVCDATPIEQAVEAAANKEDNRRKLGITNAQEGLSVVTGQKPTNFPIKMNSWAI